MNRDDSPRVKYARIKLRTAYADLLPYREAHVLRVGRMGRGDRQRVIGLWHDAVEDGVADRDTLIAAGLTEAEMDDVRALTKRPTQAYDAYLDALCAEGSTDALMVKCYDILDHLDPIRAVSLSGVMRKQYLDAYNSLLRELGKPDRKTLEHLDWLRESSGWRTRMLERKGETGDDRATPV